MWRASETRARDLETSPPTTSRTMAAAVTIIASRSRERPSARWSCARPWSSVAGLGWWCFTSAEDDRPEVGGAQLRQGDVQGQEEEEDDSLAGEGAALVVEGGAGGGGPPAPRGVRRPAGDEPAHLPPVDGVLGPEFVVQARLLGGDGGGVV